MDIAKVLSAIEKETDFSFLYNYELKSLNKKVDFIADDLSLGKALDKLFAGNDLTYKMVNENLVVILSADEGEKKSHPGNRENYGG